MYDLLVQNRYVQPPKEEVLKIEEEDKWTSKVFAFLKKT